MNCSFCKEVYVPFAEPPTKGWFSDPYTMGLLCPRCYKKVVRTYFIEQAAKLGLSFAED